MRRAHCEWCGADAVEGTTCPRGVQCPDCLQPPGSPCLRPSGHQAAQLHKARIEVAEIEDVAIGLGPEDIRREEGRL